MMKGVEQCRRNASLPTLLSYSQNCCRTVDSALASCSNAWQTSGRRAQLVFLASRQPCAPSRGFRPFSQDEYKGDISFGYTYFF